MEKKIVIGFSGWARSGKDTAADALTEIGFYKASFAGALKKAAGIIFGLSNDQLHGDAKEVVDPYWEMSPREILQRFGTECLRERFSEDVWVKALFRSIERNGGWSRWVISDVRFPNEARAIQEAGGYVIRVNRPGNEPPNGHVSERALDEWKFDATILNDSTLDIFKARVSLAALELVQK